ncbi:RhtX/FptX family siderophore transporter [Rhodospirillum rubrum]|uniref:Major facilitator superfamily MFS_1 n=1 Tax=Rhodospirillum rubrum (strain ATCC 11170 / ATH 1.1.1 / DSM 467 / LMG 4362 / NCIMB 8255 / S1) TaxID=269796 RepID=Q2RW46_RHORT|nr:RhtX/FptX family siderophore transporter [Rhodospirillum rubrum]ABC21649.1 Major facilitator superfamily MFS_1 [Rhodospirillum rubrum ATCC 11170]AEO47343.1 major facilitator transporter [Rhodospirillum rubrum F11]MBK5953201.1 MFS transporter [Rhodospirillum rubrum]QXG81315.1 RhtX/FptX family siderophore transporter [Rhodospirillum rubrum]
MLELLRHRRLVVTLALLYVSQGLPIGIAMDALPTLLRHDGASLRALAFLPLVGLPWVVKFLWASWVDNHWTARLGRRRSWILPMQGVVLACLLGLALVGVGVASAGWVVGLMAVASLASATQDIATDGMAAEHFAGDLLTKVNAIQVAGVMIGFFAGGAGNLILVGHFGQTIAFLTLFCVPLASLVFVGLLPPDAPRGRADAAPAGASLWGFIRRPMAPSLLLLALLSAMTAVSGFGLSKLFLTDAGWALEDIGRLGMSGGMITILLGCGGGVWLVKRIGLWRGFGVGVFFAGVSGCLWSLQAVQWLSVTEGVVWVCIVLGSLSTGITSVAILTEAMRLAGQGDQAGTDITAVQSTRDLGELLASSSLVAVTARLGYGGAFLGGCLLAILALTVALRLRRRERRATMATAEEF